MNSVYKLVQLSLRLAALVTGFLRGVSSQQKKWKKQRQRTPRWGGNWIQFACIKKNCLPFSPPLLSSRFHTLPICVCAHAHVWCVYVCVCTRTCVVCTSLCRDQGLMVSVFLYYSISCLRQDLRGPESSPSGQGWLDWSVSPWHSPRSTPVRFAGTAPPCLGF